MREVIRQRWQTVIEKVPEVFGDAGTVLVAVDHFCISIGTEVKGLRSGEIRLWKRALSRPGSVPRGLQSAMGTGPRRSWSLLLGQLAAENATVCPAVGTVGERPRKWWDGPVPIAD